MKILVTGGCGFIGSNFIKYLLTYLEFPSAATVVNLDKQTYAGRGRNLEHMGLANHERYHLIAGDICDKGLVERVMAEEKPKMIINFAAESHVDRSIQDSGDFVMTNIVGTANLLDAASKAGIQKFVQVSTDEVYGSLMPDGPASKETDPLHPRSPYAASKAAAEHLALSYFHTHGLPVVVTRGSNTYGPYQFPEKLLPLFITHLIDRKKVPLMWSPENPGLNVRDWIHVKDHCDAIWYVAENGKNGEIYNIPGENERSNAWMTQKLLEIFRFGEEMIEHVPHRKAHDFRYAMDGSKLRQLGHLYFYPVEIEKELPALVEWYQKNENWWRPLKTAK